MLDTNGRWTAELQRTFYMSFNHVVITRNIYQMQNTINSISRLTLKYMCLRIILKNYTAFKCTIIVTKTTIKYFSFDLKAANNKYPICFNVVTTDFISTKY